MEQSPKGSRYQIRVRGLMSDTLIGAFPGLQAHAEPGATVLDGYLPDHAALYGLIAELEELGLQLIEIRSGDSDDPPHT